MGNGQCFCNPFYSGDTCQIFKGCPSKLNKSVCKKLIDSNGISMPGNETMMRVFEYDKRSETADSHESSEEESSLIFDLTGDILGQLNSALSEEIEMIDNIEGVGVGVKKRVGEELSDDPININDSDMDSGIENGQNAEDPLLSNKNKTATPELSNNTKKLWVVQLGSNTDESDATSKDIPSNIL